MSGIQAVCRKRCQSGFTLVEVGIVVATIALLTIITIPNLMRARERSWQVICVANLDRMQAAKTLAAFDMRWGNTAGPTTIGNPYYRNTVSQYIQGGERPVCPSGYSCYYNGVSEAPTCLSEFTGHEYRYNP